MTPVIDSIKRHQTVAFFLFTYALSWTAWKAFDRSYLDGQVVALPFLMLGIFGPGLVSIGLSALLDPARRRSVGRSSVIGFVLAWPLATLLVTLNQALVDGRAMSGPVVGACAAAALMPAFVVAAVFSRAPGIGRLFDSLVRPRGRLSHYLLALTVFALIWSLGVAVSRILGVQVPTRELPASAAQVGLAGAVALHFCYNVMLNGFSEEVGWRGFALPRLQARYSPLAASLVLWLFWSLWHAPAYLGGFAPQSLVNTLVEWALVMPVAIIFTWLYNRAGGSLAVVMLLHPAMNTATRFMPITLVGIGLLATFAVFVACRDRMWRRLPPAEDWSRGAWSLELGLEQGPRRRPPPDAGIPAGRS